MILSKHTPTQLFTIWQPRWRDKKVLLAKHKIGTHNEIVFTKAKSLPDHYYISGEEVKKHQVDSNGTIDCYAVPMSQLEVLERGEPKENERDGNNDYEPELRIIFGVEAKS